MDAFKHNCPSIFINFINLNGNLVRAVANASKVYWIEQSIKVDLNHNSIVIAQKCDLPKITFNNFPKNNVCKYCPFFS